MNSSWFCTAIENRRGLKLLTWACSFLQGRTRGLPRISPATASPGTQTQDNQSSITWKVKPQHCVNSNYYNQLSENVIEACQFIPGILWEITLLRLGQLKGFYGTLYLKESIRHGKQITRATVLYSYTCVRCPFFFGVFSWYSFSSSLVCRFFLRRLFLCSFGSSLVCRFFFIGYFCWSFLDTHQSDTE